MTHEGVINILKPPGMTSSNVVSDVRRILSEKRVGHTGTLDPGAAGVLPICVGRATRLFDYLVDKKKEYIAEVTFGIATDSQDAYGMITESADCDISANDVESVLPRFTGDIEQTAPMYSALSVNGTRLYKLARSGIEVERAVRHITVYSLEILEKTGKNRFLLRVSCSKGAYVRTLCYDIGRALGVPAFMSFLLRTVAGEFRIENSVTIPELQNAKDQGGLSEVITPVDRALHFLPEINVEGKKTLRHLTNGIAIDVPNERNMNYRVYGAGDFLGIGRVDDAGMLSLRVSFAKISQNT